MSGVRRAIPRRPSAASLMSREVTTLLLGFGLRLGLGRRRRLVFILFDGFVFILLHEARHVHDQITRGKIHVLDALRVNADDKVLIGQFDVHYLVTVWSYDRV